MFNLSIIKRAILIAIFLLLMVSTILWQPIINPQAQTITGTLSGTVIDQNRVALTGVLVRIEHLQTGFVYAKRTDSEGIYRIDFLPAGEYGITATKEGYYPTVIPKFVAEVNREKVIKPPPIQLYPLSNPTLNNPTSTTPTAPAERTLQANISDATIRGNATTKFIMALPLSGLRSFDEFALLVPGVAPPPANRGSNGPGIGIGVGTSGQFAVNGQRARANNFTIDGSDNNDQDVGVRRQGFTLVSSQILESITEFQISTLLSDAEAGRNTGGQINVVTRSGSNRLHGELFGFFTNDRFNARDFFDLSGLDNPAKNPFTRTQVGGTAGFSLIPNRLEIFTSFEHSTINRIQENHFSVPTLFERIGALRAAQGASRLGRAILDTNFYPLPNNPGGPYGDNTLTRIIPASGKGTLFSIKADYQFPFDDRATTLSGRYNFTDDETRIPTVDNAINSSITALTRTQNLAFAFNTDLSPQMANQLRFSFGRTALNFAQVAGSPFIFQTASTGQDFNGDGIADGRSGPIGRIILAPFSSIGVDPGTFPQGRVSNTFQIANTTIINRGNNSFKFGFDIRRVQLNSFLDRNYRTQISFNSGIIKKDQSPSRLGNGIDFAAFGAPSDIFQALALTPDSTLGLRFTEMNLFIHNQWRATRNLTLEFGLRYERNSVPTDTNHRLEDSLTLQDSQLPPSSSILPTTKNFFNALNAQREFLAGRDKIYQGDNNNFAPRVSFAYDLSKNGRTALRGGYGISYDPILGTLVSQSRNAFPNFIPLNFGSGVIFPKILKANPAFINFGVNGEMPLVDANTVNTLAVPPDQFVNVIGQLFGGILGGGGFGAGITLPAKDLNTAYVQQYSLSLEHIFFNRYAASIAYVGTKGENLLRVRTPNGGQFTPVGIQLVKEFDPIVLPLLNRPNTNLGAITIFESSASSQYNSLQISVTRKFSDRFEFQSAYTYAHAIDDVSDIFELSGSNVLAQDELQRNDKLSSERGDANFDIRHRFTFAWNYQLPGLFNRSYLNGFQLSGIVTLQTGQPFTVNTNADINVDGNSTDRLNTLNGLLIKDRGRTRISILPNTSLRSLVAFLDLKNPINGAIGRNTFRSAGVATLDLALNKSFILPHQQQITLRIEGFNLFNRVHFGTPVRILESPAFGSSTDTKLAARTIQFALRYQF